MLNIDLAGEYSVLMLSILQCEIKLRVHDITPLSTYGLVDSQLYFILVTVKEVQDKMVPWSDGDCVLYDRIQFQHTGWLGILFVYTYL